MMDSSITEETRRKARNTDLRTEFSSLIQNTYRNAQPVMVSSGDALYAAFLRGNSSSGNVYIAVSRYDGKNWQTGVAVNSSNIMDSAPNLVVDSKGRGLQRKQLRAYAPAFIGGRLSDPCLC